MQLTPERQVENDIYTTIIKPSAFGTTSATSDEELAMLVDHPQVLNYADITFEDTFLIVSGLPVISTDPAAVNVKIENLLNKKFNIDENLNIEFSFSADKVTDAEVDGTIFTTKQQVAQAKAILFETKVLAQIKVLLDKARAYLNDFEVTSEVTL